MLSLCLCLALAAAPQFAAPAGPRPPAARTVDVPPRVRHGGEHRDDRAVRAHLAAENAHAAGSRLLAR